MNRRQVNRICQLRREGYKVWRIAEMVNKHINTVAHVLVNEGVMSAKNIEFILSVQRKKTKDEVRECVRKMRERRKSENMKRALTGTS